MKPPPSPWPRLGESWWVFALAGVAVVIFPAALVVEIGCRRGRCSGSFVERVFALDALGGLPRLFTTGLFVAVAVLAWLARRRSAGRPQLWWTAVAVIGALLALAKLVSAHSSGKGISAVVALVVGVILTVVALGALAVTGRRWGVPATRSVVLALAIYAAVALGLDAVTSALEAAQDRVGMLTRVAATFGEELGEALTALYVLVTVRWHLPTDDRSPGLPPREPALSTRRSPG